MACRDAPKFDNLNGSTVVHLVDLGCLVPASFGIHLIVAEETITAFFGQFAGVNFASCSSTSTLYSSESYLLYSESLEMPAAPFTASLLSS